MPCSRSQPGVRGQFKGPSGGHLLHIVTVFIFFEISLGWSGAANKSLKGAYQTYTVVMYVNGLNHNTFLTKADKVLLLHVLPVAHTLHQMK